MREDGIAMTPEQLREIYRQRQMRPVRTEYHRVGTFAVPRAEKPSDKTVRVVKPVANFSGGCCGKRRTTS